MDIKVSSSVAIFKLKLAFSYLKEEFLIIVINIIVMSKRKKNISHDLSSSDFVEHYFTTRSFHFLCVNIFSNNNDMSTLL